MALTDEQVIALYAKKDDSSFQRERRTPDGFNRAALFLLDLQFDNLFDPVGPVYGDWTTFRCKGCGDSPIKRRDREHHYWQHKREVMQYAA